MQKGNKTHTGTRASHPEMRVPVRTNKSPRLLGEPGFYVVVGYPSRQRTSFFKKHNPPRTHHRREELRGQEAPPESY